MRIGLTLGVWLLMAVASPLAAGGWEDLPLSLRRALAEPEHPFMTYARWGEARGHPVLLRALELREHGEMPSIELVKAAYGSLFGLLDRGVVDGADLAEAWIVSVKPDSPRFERAWLHCEVSASSLEQYLVDGGWLPVPGTHDRLWGHPGDGVEADDEALGAGEERDLALRNLMRGQPQVQLVGDGWLLVHPPGDDPEAESRVEDAVADPPDVEKLRFPFDRIAEPETGVLFLVAADLPQETPDQDEDEEMSTETESRPPESLDTSAAIVEEMRQVEARLRVLRRQPEATVGRMLADFVASVTETDGGLALWIEARCGDPDVADMTSAMLSAVVSTIRVMVFHASRDLWWELGHARIDVHGDSVLLEVRASSSSLLEALDNEVERRSEMDELRQRSRELYDRLEEIRQERERQAQDAP